MKRQYQVRSLSLAIIFAVLAALVVLQIVRIQTSPEAATFLRQADRYAGKYVTLFPERGRIFDRDGFLLAGNQSIYEIGVSLAEVKNPHTIALTLNTILGLNYEKVYNDLINPPSGIVYMVLTDFVSSEKAHELIELKSRLADEYKHSGDPSLAGLHFKAHLMRSYPEKSLASNVLGFVTLENRGYFGVEEKYNNLLAGVPLTVWVPEDPNRAAEIPATPRGADLILTIDREIQAMVEEQLRESLVDTGAEAGTIIVMDPRTGEILAMASTPQMDLNNFSQYNEIYKNASEFNRAISIQYEPGSVFKVLTLAAALDSGAVSSNFSYLDVGFYEIGGAYVYNWDRGAWGPQDLLGCMRHSLNVCMTRLADQMGPDKFYTYMRRFGVGHPTGIDLSNEARGRLKVPGDSDWYKVDLGTNSFGQGVAVTPIQMMAAASALANDGRMVYPHVLYGMVSNGHQYNTPVQTLGTPISPQTARMTSEMLATAMEQAKMASLVEGYRIAGKTGTAQIPGPDGYYLPNEINASFIGWGPVDSPRFMVYIWFEKPDSADWASYIAAPVFREVVEKLVVLMGIPPDDVRQRLVGQ
jgi:cell division protein FtsI/penicillin-binding protein 2